MTYKEQLIKALYSEGYEREELVNESVETLEQLVKDTIGMKKFNLKVEGYNLLSTI